MRSWLDYAVETVLGHSRGFYGLVAEGWDLADFGKPWPKGPLPIEALASELVVGFLDQERATGVEWSASQFNEGAARSKEAVMSLTSEGPRRSSSAIR